ncbi:family 20 glycosylhydrolase [Pontibacter sp. KCTC 32443]|uniref:glycoside hydrolase family 20 protein n=1 Tax=Pontibacter TaxID=323449 RepID=UPI00164DDB1D|nr:MULTISPECIES: family 20 glycosylhydrolase [Pontibacter]MBC5775490.1 family 20 glycosylhydrolase [Pontibacter sp. KCTC 32443]
MLRPVLLILFILSILILPASAQYKTFSSVSIIPQPQQIKEQEGNFILNANTRIYLNPDQQFLEFTAQQLAQDIKKVTGQQPQVLFKNPKKRAANYILITLTNTPDTLGPEGYTLNVEPTKIILAANQPAGIAMGIQTINQLLPIKQSLAPVTIPAVVITDKPRYNWRGLHLDVARHFFPVSDIKKYIDYMAMHKLNTFHWHLTDDQGWRIEIKKYPKLTQVGAWREGTLVGHALERPQQFDNKKYGGYYTQDEIREVVQYAKERHITVVPEIEMPGHALAALAAYPELSCTGGPFKTERAWGIFEDVFCAGNEQTYTFLQDVLSEVTELFPGQVMHIGGDEVPKTRWKACPKCQARMETENLKNENELQSYFIERIRKFMKAKGKRIMGWDEILDGGIPANALIMSWRGTAGGIKAAEQQHGVVMTPTSHLYFDYYQGDQNLEPLAFGGYTPLSKVYSFNPTPEKLTLSEQRFILGAQANLWTEYIPTFKQVEYMLFPRIAAAAEVFWTNPENKNWEDFKQRMQPQYQRYDVQGINYATSAFQVKQQVTTDTTKRHATITFTTDAAGTQVFYTLDGSTPTTAAQLYTEPFIVNKSATIKAASFADGKMTDEPTATKLTIHKAFARPVKLQKQPSRYFKAMGGATLVNGLTGSENQNDGQWLGFATDDFEAVVDLEQATTISHISSSQLQNMLANIFLPTKVEFAVSEDGKNYKSVKNITNTTDPLKGGIFTQNFSAGFDPLKARYIKVTARNIKVCPPKHRSAGKTAWLFVSEVVVE